MDRRRGARDVAPTLARRGAVAAGCALVLTAGWPTAAAQSAGKVSRIGYLALSAAARLDHDFVQGLREAGWHEGRNVAIEYRFADGRPERLPALAAELVRLGVDLIVAQGTAPAVAAKGATGTIPIVFHNVGDPPRQGLVESLARPGGNLTGTAFDPGLETIVKSLQLLKEALPDRRRVAVLTNPAHPLRAVLVADLNAAARSLEMHLTHVPVAAADEFERAFEEVKREQAQALLIVAEGLFLRNRERVAELALQHSLPSMHGFGEHVDSGGLMSYGPSLRLGARRAAAFADRILKGARPTDLPVEQPTRFELRVNLKTAKALGVTIAPSLLLRADEVIE